MNALLAKTREALGPAPRTIAAWDNYTPPPWMTPQDPLRATYARHLPLLQTGDVIWGHIVQANSLLFRAGNDNCPALIAFGADPTRESSPDALRRVSHSAFAWKNVKLPPEAEPELARVARSLTSELERDPTLDLPHAITAGTPVRVAGVMVHRPMLPTGFLSTSLLPLVANAARDEVVLLPCRYWAADLRRAWVVLGAARD